MEELQRPGLTRKLLIALLILLFVAGYIVLAVGSQGDEAAPGASNTGAQSGVNNGTPVERVQAP